VHYSASAHKAGILECWVIFLEGGGYLFGYPRNHDPLSVCLALAEGAMDRLG
jgi:hypothetical protein